MGSVDYLSYGFALVVLSGGVMGYMKAGELARWCIQPGGVLQLGMHSVLHHCLQEVLCHWSVGLRLEDYWPMVPLALVPTQRTLSFYSVITYNLTCVCSLQN